MNNPPGQIFLRNFGECDELGGPVNRQRVHALYGSRWDLAKDASEICPLVHKHLVGYDRNSTGSLFIPVYRRKLVRLSLLPRHWGDCAVPSDIRNPGNVSHFSGGGSIVCINICRMGSTSYWPQRQRPEDVRPMLH